MPTVLFGISGSIAAFKALEVIRLLVADGVEVVAVLSEGGSQFVTRPTVEALTGRRAITEIFPENSQQEIEHIALAQKAALLVTCPASADILAKYACGIADDPLALVALAFGTPHVIAPAMNHRMWEHPATRENVKLLKDRGCIFVGPDKGMMACGEEGWGRLAKIEEIYGRICAELGKNGPLAGRRVVVSAGGTREPIDKVRYVSNKSTGRMGYAIAAVARDMGADVTLVTSSELDPPAAVDVKKVETASEMREAVISASTGADIVLMTAAVADFTPDAPIEGKIKKAAGGLSINFLPTSDILQELGKKKPAGQVLVGFAAEYGSDSKAEAVRKCREKSCDVICLNDISRTDIGFGSGENEIQIVFPDGREKKIEKASKRAVAREILIEAAGMLKGRKAD